MKKHIIFDLDGTLIDSAKGIYNAFVKSCQKVELVPPSLKKFKTHIGPPIQIIANNIFKNESYEKIVQIERIFREAYDGSGFLEYRIYKNADRIIETLSKDEDIVMSIVTNKPSLLAAKIIDKQGWKEHFCNVVGIDFLKVKYSKDKFKSKSEAIRYAIDVSRIKHNKTCYIGDTPGDREASEQSNIKFIAAKYGFYNWKEDEIKSRPFINNIEELLEIIYDSKL